MVNGDWLTGVREANWIFHENPAPAKAAERAQTDKTGNACAGSRRLRRCVRVFFAFVALSIVRCQLSVAQVPVEDDVVAQTLNTDGEYFYPRMMERYMAGDSTLTARHYHYLYFGYAYTDAYDAHKELPGLAVMSDIFRAAGDNPTHADALILIEAGRQNMQVDPFSPSNINMMTWAYEAAGDTLNAVLSADRFRKIVGAIEGSGSGLRENSPWHILRFSHAEDVVAAKGFKVVNRQVRKMDIEYLQLAPNRERIKGYFIDFSRVYSRPFDGERKKRKSKWELNGIPL
jgi:hypothetical protein